MPLLRLCTSATMDDETRDGLLREASRLVAKVTGKPERYVMVSVTTSSMVLGGDGAPAAFADVRAIGGLGGDVNGRLTEGLCRILHERLRIPGERVYCTFTDVPAADWGWNGSTFG